MACFLTVPSNLFTSIALYFLQTRRKRLFWELFACSVLSIDFLSHRTFIICALSALCENDGQTNLTA